MAWPILGEKLTFQRAMAGLLGICGIAVLVGGSGLHLDAAKLPGVAVALAAALFFAAGTVWSKHRPVPLPRLALTAWQVLLGCTPLLVIGLLFEQPHFGSMPLVAWLSLAYTAVVSMGLCYVLWFAAITRLEASQAAIGTFLVPVIGVTASSVVLGDPLTASQVVSLIMVVGGIVLAVRG
jgi:drug/metabolite transporter (DMT)-like permease